MGQKLSWLLADEEAGSGTKNKDYQPLYLSLQDHKAPAILLRAPIVAPPRAPSMHPISALAAHPDNAPAVAPDTPASAIHEYQAFEGA